MDFWNYFRAFLIIFFTGAVGGGIAFLGNQLGRYIGRKKMSIFKLRPRHTSMLFTVFTGGMIAAITLIVAMIFSEPVRITLIDPKSYERKITYLEDMIKKYSQLQRTDLVYKKQDVILSAVIRADTDSAKMEQALKEIIAEANRAAISKSEAIAKEKGESFIQPPGGRLAGYIPENLNSVARELTRLSGDYVIFARANQHATMGSVFLVELGNPLPNQRIFAKGELVQKTPVNGKLDYSEIYELLLKNIKVDITQMAINRGVFPNPEDGSIGEFDDKQMKELAKKIRRIDKTLTVGFYALDDTYLRGPLKLEARILSEY